MQIFLDKLKKPRTIRIHALGNRINRGMSVLDKNLSNRVDSKHLTQVLIESEHIDFSQVFRFYKVKISNQFRYEKYNPNEQTSELARNLSYCYMRSSLKMEKVDYFFE